MAETRDDSWPDGKSTALRLNTIPAMTDKAHRAGQRRVRAAAFQLLSWYYTEPDCRREPLRDGNRAPVWLTACSGTRRMQPSCERSQMPLVYTKLRRWWTG